jgi:3-phosphoshikimate 1-carboxyvinyltransferase
MEDGLVIHGGNKLTGGNAEGWNDHRIVMALSVAALASEGPVIISGSEAVAKSYPDFFRDFVKIGVEVHERNLG